MFGFVKASIFPCLCGSVLILRYASYVDRHLCAYVLLWFCLVAAVIKVRLLVCLVSE